MRYYDKLIFELSHPGRTGYSLPSAQQYPVATIPANLLREEVDYPLIGILTP